MRTEEQIFNELEVLASTPGYAHALAALCFRDNIITFEDQVKTEDISKMFSYDRLLRTEISTLVGLMIKSDLVLRLPSSTEIQALINKTEALLRELHEAFNMPAIELIRRSLSDSEIKDPFSQGSILREPIFYGGESAYIFQYRDFSIPKYSLDNKWLIANKGFSIQEARDVIIAITELQIQKVSDTINQLKATPPKLWTILPAYIFTPEEVAAKSGLKPEIIKNVIVAFSLPSNEKNTEFRSVSDFNSINAFPVIPISDTEYLLFQCYSIAEALYESPFYWMLSDSEYEAQANNNRGIFCEEFCNKRLRDVFGDNRVYKNVSLLRGKKKTVGEIDVLVTFANRIIIVQAKSKKLTIESRKGNDNQIKEDFKHAITDAYEQGLSCAKLLSDSSVNLVSGDSTIIELPAKLKEIYIFCILSEHYPALAFQADQFIQAKRLDTIMPPFILDIFTLDAVAEMLNTPLYFLSYGNRRTNYASKIKATHELTILAYHLKQNLWIDSEYDFVQLGDDISSDLDIAMLSRRNGVPGAKTPEGILTKFTNTRVGQLIKQIEDRDDRSTIDLGFILLTLSEESVNQLSRGIEAIINYSKSDGKNHDISMGLKGLDCGITIHSNFDSNAIALERLTWHCEIRKYSERTLYWYGICLEPKQGNIRFGLNLEHPWEQSDQMDEALAKLPKGKKLLDLDSNTKKQKTKIGRNDPCPCGSGKKYKYCCLNRT